MLILWMKNHIATYSGTQIYWDKVYPSRGIELMLIQRFASRICLFTTKSKRLTDISCVRCKVCFQARMAHTCHVAQKNKDLVVQPNPHFFLDAWKHTWHLTHEISVSLFQEPISKSRRFLKDLCWKTANSCLYNSLQTFMRQMSGVLPRRCRTFMPYRWKNMKKRIMQPNPSDKSSG